MARVSRCGVLVIDVEEQPYRRHVCCSHCELLSNRQTDLFRSATNTGMTKKSARRPRLGLRDFVGFHVDFGFQIVDFWISEWISGFQLDFWISDWISVDSVRDFFRGGPLGKVQIKMKITVFSVALLTVECRNDLWML